MDQNDSMTLTVRSLITPDEPITGFIRGEAIKMDLPVGMTMGELIDKIFYKKFDQIGVMAVNGGLASSETRLSPGDVIDFYPLLEGG
jgi:molybdopterin converting factor small subunit